MTLKCIFRIPLCFWLSRESVWHLGRATINAKFQAPTHWKVTHSVWPGRVFVRESKPFLFLKISSVCLCMSPGSGLAWSAEVGVVCTLIYSHSWAGHISMFCSGSWAGGAFLHFVIGQCSTLWPRQYISLCRRTESSYILNIGQPGIFFSQMNMNT